MATIQVPPAVGASGQFLESAIVTSSQNRQIVGIGDGGTTALLSVTTSAGALVTISSGTVTLSSVHTVTLSSVHTVTATAATNPWSSAPGFNLPVVNVSSGLVQISGTPTIFSASSGSVQLIGTVGTSTPELSTGPQLVQMTTAGAIRVFSTTAAGAGSTTVNVQGTGTAIVSVATSGAFAGSLTVFLSSVPTVTATAATNPWSSAPSFNVPIVSVSSGLVQISGTASVLTASSGMVQLVGTVGTTTPEFSTGPQLLQMTTAGSLRVFTSASAAGSTTVNVQGTGTAIVSVATSGSFAGALVTLSHVTGTSGITAIVTSSGALLVSGTPGSVSTAINIVGSSNATVPGTSSGGLSIHITDPMGPVTTSFGALVQVSSGSLMSLTSGLVSLSSVHTFLSASSGFVQALQAPSTMVVTTSDGSRAWFIDQRTQTVSTSIQFQSIRASSSGHTSIVTAVTSMRIFLLGYAIIADSSNTVLWESSGVDLCSSMLMSTAGVGIVCPLVSPAQGAWMQTSVNGDLGLFLGNAGGISGHLTYYTASS